MKHKSKYLFGTIILFILAGIGITYVSHVQKVKAAEVQRIIETSQEMVENLYYNDRKEALADDISDKNISKALNKAKQVKDISLQKSLVKEIKNIAFLYKTRTEIDGLLIEGVLIEEAEETKIAALSKSVDEVKPINSKIYNEFKSDLDEIYDQFNTIKTAKEKLFALFSDTEAIAVKGDITRDMFNEAKGSIDSIKNTKVKESFASLVAKVDSELTAKEEQEKIKKQQLENSIKSQTNTKTSSTQSQAKTNTNTNTPQLQTPVPNGQVQSASDLASIVASSGTASKTNQIVTVVASGNSAKISLFEKNGSTWTEVIKTNGYVGSLGVGQAREGSSRTPKGSYSLGFAFGTSNPGTKLPFRQITPNSYWISNVNDPQYNTWQERESASPADEHLADYPVQYQYAIVINYNNGVGGGSAFFLHVANGRPTAGCVSVSKEVMVQFMQRIASGAYIINVNSQSEIASY